MSGLDRLRVVAGWIILGLFAGAVVLNAVQPEYDIPAPLIGAFAAVTVVLFGPNITRRNGLKEDEPK